MDVIPLDATLVKGSHGRLTDDAQMGRCSSRAQCAQLLPDGPIAATAVKDIVLAHVFE